MKGVVRTLALWLMVMAIPLQGFAGSPPQLCGAGHAIAQARTTAPALLDPSMHATSTAPAAADMHHDHGSAERRGSAAQDSDPAAGHSVHSVLNCCSAACSMAAVAACDLVVHTQASSSAPVHPLASLYRGVVLDGLDRPPRITLA